MFTRPEESYALDPEGLQRILDDPANPLFQISAGIAQGSSVLDVGAGNGVLAQLLTARCRSVVIDGVEPSSMAASLASHHYRQFHRGTLAEFSEHVSADGYDNIVLADVIEHTQDPVLVLQRVRELLSLRGQLWISVPNVAFAPIRAELLNGSWTYSDWGILERTHLRFFNRSNLLELLHAAGFGINHLFYLCRSPFLMEKRIQDYDLDLLSLLKIRSDPLAFVYQFLAVCRLASTAESKELLETWVGLEPHLVREYFARRRASQR